MKSPARITAGLALALSATIANAEVTPERARDIAEEAYIYGFPMVMHFKTMAAYVLDTTSPEYKAPFNKLGCKAQVYTPEDKAIVTPNSDTPYCMGYLDLRAEPVVISVPQIDPNRYYSMQMIDLFTHNIGYIGNLTIGSEAGNYMMTGPGWQGDVPPGIDAVIPSETDLVLIINRTQIFGPDDLQNVADIQDAYDTQPLSTFLGGPEIVPVGQDSPPVWVEGAQFDARSFAYLDYLLSQIEPANGEEGLRHRFGEIGIGTKAAFDLEAFPADVQAAISQGIEDARAKVQKTINEKSNDLDYANGVFGTRVSLRAGAAALGEDSYYILRAGGAFVGIFGNTASEAMYPTYFTDADGVPLDASAAAYTITFEAGRLPPVRSFWSLTMYDGATQLLIDNPLDRYLLNSEMMDQFVMGDDGSLTFTLQAKSPGPELEANWLPTPSGPFYAVMRLYGPKPEALSGDWTVPPLIRVAE